MLIMSKKNNNVIMNHRGRPVKGVTVSLDNLATFDNHSIHELLAYCKGTFIKVVILDPDPLSPLIRLKDLSTNHQGVGDVQFPPKTYSGVHGEQNGWLSFVRELGTCFSDTYWG